MPFITLGDDIVERQGEVCSKQAEIVYLLLDSSHHIELRVCVCVCVWVLFVPALGRSFS